MTAPPAALPPAPGSPLWPRTSPVGPGLSPAGPGSWCTWGPGVGSRSCWASCRGGVWGWDAAVRRMPRWHSAAASVPDCWWRSDGRPGGQNLRGEEREEGGQLRQENQIWGHLANIQEHTKKKRVDRKYSSSGVLTVWKLLKSVFSSMESGVSGIQWLDRKSCGAWQEVLWGLANQSACCRSLDWTSYYCHECISWTQVTYRWSDERRSCDWNTKRTSFTNLRSLMAEYENKPFDWKLIHFCYISKYKNLLISYYYTLKKNSLVFWHIRLIGSQWDVSYRQWGRDHVDAIFVSLWCIDLDHCRQTDRQLDWDRQTEGQTGQQVKLWLSHCHISLLQSSSDFKGKSHKNRSASSKIINYNKKLIQSQVKGLWGSLILMFYWSMCHQTLDGQRGNRLKWQQLFSLETLLIPDWK